MRWNIFFLFGLGMFANAFYAKAQDDIKMTDTIIRTRKPLMLSFGLDCGIQSLSADYKHDYTGEYNVNGTGPTGWEWVSHKADYNNVLPYGKLTDVRLSVLIANTKIYQIGLSYNFGTASIPATVIDANGNVTTLTDNPQIIDYVGICLATEYNYYFNKKTYLGPYAYGGIDFGFYSGSDQVFGTGTPLYLQGRLGFGYDFKKDILIKAFISSDHLIYWQNETSQVYQRPQSLNINFNALYIGIGISKTFTLYPD